MIFHVYILTNKSGTLYTGVTNDLQRRVQVSRADISKLRTFSWRGQAGSLAAASGAELKILYTLLLVHMNQGRSKGRLTPRDEESVKRSIISDQE